MLISVIYVFSARLRFSKIQSQIKKPRSIYKSTFNMKFTLTVVIASILSIVTANPYPIPHAKPIPQAPKAVGSACQSTSWEKVHEGHGHNINDGTVSGANLGLKLPGGTGCYKGAKVGSAKI
jgi:hypothetical protein